MEKPAAKKVEKYDNLLPEPEKKKTEPKEKKRRRKKSPSIIDLLMPAPRFDPNDMEQTKNLKLKVKKDDKGKLVTPSAD
jgi:hypothetical protein